MLSTHHTNQTPPSSPPSSPFPPSSSPPSSPSLDPFALDSDDDESSSALSHSYTLGEPASGSSEALEQGVFGHGFGYGYTSEGAPMDPLAGAYRPYPYRNAKRARVARVACSPGQTPMKKKARFRSRSPVGWGGDGVDVYLGEGEGIDVDGEVTVETSAEVDTGGGECNVDPEVAAALEEERERKRQKALWDSALEEAFESGEVKIDLTDKNIVDIPSEVVRDLAKFVVLSQKNEPVPATTTTTVAVAVEAVDDIRAGMASSNGNGHGPAAAPRSGFARTQTAPAESIGAWARQGPSAKAVSTSSILGVSREAMDIFLGRNNITKLPMELWSLHNLTVLSLRNNCLTYIPPEIANLRDLQTLNLAHNKLRYIPSEMLQMKKLTQLNLFPNPFLPKPPPNRDGNYVSRTERIGPKIPPLTELALRVLLSRKETRETMLEQYYELPLATSQDQRPVTAFRDILSICVPGSVLPDESRAGRKQFKVARPVTGVGICPNPMHDDESNFIRPSEERYTWVESTPAMKTKGAESGGLGGHAAVHWRGCMWGCLDFLGIAGEDEDTKKQEKEAEEEGMDLDLQESEEVVQTVRFDTATGWDFDD